MSFGVALIAPVRVSSPQTCTARLKEAYQYLISQVEHPRLFVCRREVWAPLLSLLCPCVYQYMASGSGGGRFLPPSIWRHASSKSPAFSLSRSLMHSCFRDPSDSARGPVPALPPPLSSSSSRSAGRFPSQPRFESFREPGASAGADGTATLRVIWSFSSSCNTCASCECVREA